MKFKFEILLFIFFSVLSINLSAQNTGSDREIVSGMVLLNDKNLFDSKVFFANLNKDWHMKADSISEKEHTIVFISSNTIVMLSQLDYPIPQSDIAAAAGISWLWKNAETEAPKHSAQLVVSVIGGSGQTVVLHKIFSKIAACALASSNSSGIYMPNSYLLLSKGYYVESARNMNEATLPLYLWVYFGVLQDKNMSSGYTYGLRAFGLQEMEIVNSSHPVAEVHACLYDAAQSVVKKNQRLF